MSFTIFSHRLHKPARTFVTLPSRSPGARDAFTLVEMMIVVMIVGLLVGMVIPNFESARTETQMNACINNLRVINAAKNIAAFELNVGFGSTIPSATLDAYMNSGRLPECPAGGVYSYNAIGTTSTCTLAADGHVYLTQ